MAGGSSPSAFFSSWRLATDHWRPQQLETTLNLIPHIGPVAALIAGILILIMPRLLNFIVAIYLIIIGVVGLIGK